MKKVSAKKYYEYFDDNAYCHEGVLHSVGYPSKCEVIDKYYIHGLKEQGVNYGIGVRRKETSDNICFIIRNACFIRYYKCKDPILKCSSEFSLHNLNLVED